MKFIIIIYTTNKLTIVEMENIRGARLRKFNLRKIILGVRMHFRHTISVCSIYLSPSSKFNSGDFDNLITQLLPPFYCLETLMPTVAYGVAPKPMLEESWSKIFCLNITCLC